jgi:hypothetical protein
MEAAISQQATKDIDEVHEAYTLYSSDLKGLKSINKATGFGFLPVGTKR